MSLHAHRHNNQDELTSDDVVAELECQSCIHWSAAGEIVAGALRP